MRTSENPVLLPYLSGVPAAGRSLDQRQLDLWLLAQRGAESHLYGPGVLGLARRFKLLRSQVSLEPKSRYSLSCLRNRFGYADAALHGTPIGRTGIVRPFYRGRPTSLPIMVRASSSRSASVSSCPHSHSKKVLAACQTDSGPPSTTFSPHSSQIRTTRLEEPTTTTPPGPYSFAGDTLSQPLGRHKVNLPRPHATSASPNAT